MATLIIYRDGSGPIEPRIKAAVRAFYEDHDRLPVAVVVSPAELGEAQEAVEVLALRVPVRKSGGCLANEVWLEVSQEGQ